MTRGWLRTVAKMRIAWKLFLTYAALIIICAVTAGIFATVSLKNHYLERIESNLKSSACLLRNLAKGNLSNIDSQCKVLGKEISTRITIIDKEGKVLGDSRDNPSRMENHADRPEVREALAGKTGKSVRHSNTLGINMMYFAIPTFVDGQAAGVIRVSLPLTEIKERIACVHRMIFLGALLAVVIAMGAGFIVSRMMSRPLRDMANLAGGIAGGDFSKKIRIHSGDEIGELAGAFNQMAEELKTKIQTITRDKNEMQAVLASIIEGIVAVDKDERVILFNSAIEKMFNLDKDKAMGKFFWEVIRNSELSSLLKEAAEEKNLRTREITLFFPEEKIFEVHALPIKNEKDESGVVAVLHDITEIKKLERMRVEFVANVSHELRTPLTSIRGFVETLKDGAVDDPENSRRFLGIIETQAERLNDLINDLLELSRIESRENKMEFQQTNLKELAEHIVSGFRQTAEQKGHIIEIDFPANFSQVRVEPEKMKQVFSNLLDNAIKFTPEKGKICIRAIDRSKDIQIEVSDTGIGISGEHLPRLFERFYRADKARSRELGGTGLGLAIVKHIIQAHGGSVRVESEQGKGSKFFFTIPKNSPQT